MLFISDIVRDEIFSNNIKLVRDIIHQKYKNYCNLSCFTLLHNVFVVAVKNVAIYRYVS